MNEIKRDKIEYYIHFTAVNSFTWIDLAEYFNDYQFLTENSDKLTEVKIEGINNNVRVFRVSQ